MPCIFSYGKAWSPTPSSCQLARANAKSDGKRQQHKFQFCDRVWYTNEETRQRHFEDLEIYTIELNKFNEGAEESLHAMLPRIKNGLDRWAAFLTRASSLDRNNLPKELDDPCIKKAVDVLNRAYLNRDENELYENHLKWMRIEADALDLAEKKGEAKGKAEAEMKAKTEKIEIAKQLLIQGMSLESVREITRLSAVDLS